MNEKLAVELCEILALYCGETGESEGPVDTLKRLIRERDQARRLVGYHSPSEVAARNWKLKPQCSGGPQGMRCLLDEGHVGAHYVHV
jgi:hypothetical protein